MDGIHGLRVAAEQDESTRVQVGPERSGGRQHHPKADAKLVPIDEQRIGDVLLCDQEIAVGKWVGDE
jgi:hypothetical protein